MNMDSFRLSFIILGDPRPLALKRPRAVSIGGHARVYDPTANRNAKEQIKTAAIAQGGQPAAPAECPLGMTVKVFVPIPKSWSKKKQHAATSETPTIFPTTRPDLDNIIKTVADALQHVFFRDDAQLCTVRASKYYSKCPKLVVTIYQIAPEE